MNRRDSTYVNIPEEYIQNSRAGLCRVCGKTRSEWNSRRIFYCSDECWSKYQECFRTWAGVRDRILRRDVCCVKCGSKDHLQVDHIKAIMNGGEMWDLKNLRALCYSCHLEKTRMDFYERKYGAKVQMKLTQFWYL